MYIFNLIFVFLVFFSFLQTNKIKCIMKKKDNYNEEIIYNYYKSQLNFLFIHFNMIIINKNKTYKMSKNRHVRILCRTIFFFNVFLSNNYIEQQQKIHVFYFQIYNLISFIKNINKFL